MSVLKIWNGSTWVELPGDVNAATVNAAGAVMESDYGPNSILAANADNTPLELTMAASTGLFRLASGDIVAATTTQMHALLGGILPRRSGKYYDGSPAGIMGVTAADQTLVADKMYAIPFLVLGEAWTTIGLEVTTFDVGKNMRLGIYALAADGTPGALQLDAGEVSVGTTGFKEFSSIAQTLAPGFWYVACNSDSSSAKVETVNRNGLAILGLASGTGTRITGWSKTGSAYGALPDPFPSSPTEETDASLHRILMSVA